MFKRSKFKRSKFNNVIATCHRDDGLPIVTVTVTIFFLRDVTQWSTVLQPQFSSIMKFVNEFK